MKAGVGMLHHKNEGEQEDAYAKTEKSFILLSVPVIVRFMHY